jgi:hypothetical protein
MAANSTGIIILMCGIMNHVPRQGEIILFPFAGISTVLEVPPGGAAILRDGNQRPGGREAVAERQAVSGGLTVRAGRRGAGEFHLIRKVVLSAADKSTDLLWRDTAQSITL